MVPPVGPAPSPSEEVTLAPPPEIELPADCREIFDEAFISEMEAAHLPLNDPGITMRSTELELGGEILATEPSLRCTWGLPSEVGIATTIALVTSEQRGGLIAEAEANEFACEPRTADEVRCSISVREEDPDWGAYAHGAEYALRGNSWVATQWLNVEIPGYTDDIVAALWD